MASKKGKGGRPSAYRVEYAAMAEKLCGVFGATSKDLAEFFGVADSTIRLWAKVEPEFSAALKGGREIADAKVTRRLFERACGFEHEAVKIMQYEGRPVVVPYVEKYPPDTTACIFWLKNRRPDLWRDKVAVEHSGSVGLAETLKETPRARAGKDRQGGHIQMSPNTTESATLGPDLVALQQTGLSTEYLFDVYGIDESIARDTPEWRAYVAAARVALAVLRQMHFKPRNGTHFRLAGAILFELATAPTCDRCAGAGRLRLDTARIQLVCPGCFGSGLRRASTTWRVNATDCHYTDFRDRLQGVYQVTLTLLAGLRRDAGKMPVGTVDCSRTLSRARLQRTAVLSAIREAG
jgi:hypothetical protein